MIQLKTGVILDGLTPQMLVGLQIVASCYAARLATCTVTSANDGKHSDASLHYEGRAMDFRTKDFKGDKASLVSLIVVSLGTDFDVVFEAEGTDNEHLHVEYDPK